MKILEQTRERLRMSHSGILAHACTFDGDEVVIIDRFLAIPFRRRRIALSNLGEVAVRRKSKSTSYDTVLRPRYGGDISLGLETKDEALEAARVIRDFLKSQRGAVAPQR